MPSCIKCGSSIQDEAKFCSSCGYKQSKSRLITNKSKFFLKYIMDILKKKSIKITGISLIALVLLFIILRPFLIEYLDNRHYQEMEEADRALRINDPEAWCARHLYFELLPGGIITVKIRSDEIYIKWAVGIGQPKGLSYERLSEIEWIGRKECSKIISFLLENNVIKNQTRVKTEGVADETNRYGDRKTVTIVAACFSTTKLKQIDRKRLVDSFLEIKDFSDSWKFIPDL